MKCSTNGKVTIICGTFPYVGYFSCPLSEFSMPWQSKQIIYLNILHTFFHVQICTLPKELGPNILYSLENMIFFLIYLKIIFSKVVTYVLFVICLRLYCIQTYTFCFNSRRWKQYRFTHCSHV